MMAELRIKFELPGGPASDAEVWPDDVTVAQMLPRVLADARDRDRAFVAAPKDWGLFLKRSNAALPREATLSAAGVQSGDVLVLKDEGEARQRREAYTAFASGVAAAGVVEAADAAELAKLRAAAGLDPAAGRDLLAAAGVPETMLERILGEKESWPEAFASYRKSLQGVPRDGNVPDDLIRALSSLRQKLQISPDVHRRLARKLSLTDPLAERLLVELPPKEDGLAAYKKELEFLRKQPPQKPSDLDPLKRLQKQHRISPSDHQAAALEAGFTAQDAEHIWDGFPPGMVEREAALETYRTALKTAWLDERITPAEAANLLSIRQKYKISAVEHMKVCQVLKIPNTLAESLLKATPAGGRRIWPALFAVAVLGSATAAAVWSLGPRLKLPGLTERDPKPSARASGRPPEGAASPSASGHSREDPPLATPVATPVESHRPPDVRPSHRAARGKGIIVITSNPSGAVVKIDNSVKGTTPLEAEETEGKHDIEIRLSGYKVIHYALEWVSGERLSWTTSLQRARR